MRFSACLVPASISTSPTRYTLIAFGGHPARMYTSSASCFIVPPSGWWSCARLAPREAAHGEVHAEQAPQRDNGQLVEIAGEPGAGHERAREPLDQRLQGERVGDRAQEPRGAVRVEHEERDEHDRQEHRV